MLRPRCLECGNTSVFVGRTIELERVYYDERGYQTDSKSLEVVESELVGCYAEDCGSDRVIWEEI